MKAGAKASAPAKRSRATSQAEEARNTGPQTDPLVPIRLDLNIDGRRIQDSFTWNLREKHMTPQSFAAQLAYDIGLSDSGRDEVAEAMQEQIAAFVPPPSAGKAECRHVVHLDLRIGRVVIRDQFEWDLHEPQNSPEAFAEQLCADLGLNFEHVAAVAHAVREQLIELAEFRDKRQRCAVLTEDDVVRPIDQVGRWEPAVVCLSVEEQERVERKEKREARLQRRNRGKAETYARTPGRRRSSDTSARRRSVG